MVVVVIEVEVVEAGDARGVLKLPQAMMDWQSS